MTSQSDLEAYDIPCSRLSCMSDDVKGRKGNATSRSRAVQKQELDLPDADRGPLKHVKAGVDMTCSEAICDMRRATSDAVLELSLYCTSPVPRIRLIPASLLFTAPNPNLRSLLKS